MKHFIDGLEDCLSSLGAIRDVDVPTTSVLST